MEENLASSLAFDLIENTSQSLFLMGKAGTGKTTFLRHFYENTYKNAVIAAPTGVAAINAGGVTLHSLFNLPFQAYLPTLQYVNPQYALNKPELINHFRFNKYKRELIREIEVLIIDEISMVRADVLDAVEVALQHVRRNQLPFGGVQLLLIGDLFQLPPVVKQHESALLQEYYSSPFFFSAKALQNKPIVNIELQKIYRQSDAVFIDLLGKVRNNELDDEATKVLNSRYIPDFENKEQYISLCTHNSQANEINEENLNKLSSKSFEYKAEIEGEFPESMYPMEETLELKKGAKVMFLKNDVSGEKLYYNGMIVEVDFVDKDSIVVKTEKGISFSVEKVEWQNKKFYVGEDHEIDEEIMGVFRHFPLRLAWAITIHKSQGLSFDNVVIDAEKAFASGQVYVALSRSTQLEGLYLKSPINSHSLQVDSHILNYSQYMSSLENVQQIVEEQRKPYALQQLFNILNLEKSKRIFNQWIILNHKNNFTDSEKISSVQVALEKPLKELQKMAKKYTNITLKKYAENPDSEEVWSEIEERSQKAVHYFVQEYEKIVKGFTAHIDEFEKKKRVASYLSEIIPMESELESELNTLKKARLLEVQLYNNRSSKNTIKRSQKPKLSTTDITLNFWKEGLSIEEIATERAMSSSTIEKHVLDLLKDGKLSDTSRLIDEKKKQSIEKKLPKDYKNVSLKKLKETLGDDATYFELRVLKHLN